MFQVIWNHLKSKNAINFIYDEKYFFEYLIFKMFDSYLKLKSYYVDYIRHVFLNFKHQFFHFIKMIKMHFDNNFFVFWILARISFFLKIHHVLLLEYFSWFTKHYKISLLQITYFNQNRSKILIYLDFFFFL